MRIALCDDEQQYIDNILQLLEGYRTPEGNSILVDTYHNGLDLLAEMKNITYDALLLDVLMPGLSGMDIAREIRTTDMQVQIIFLTGSPEFAVESYRVHATDYLLKPVQVHDLFQTLNHVYAVQKGKEKESLTVTSAKCVHVIPYDQLEYLEINKRTLSFHLLDKNVYEVIGKLSDYEEKLLAKENFMKIHRSIIINMDCMKLYDKKTFLTITGEKLPIARDSIKEVQERYMKYLHDLVHGKLSI